MSEGLRVVVGKDTYTFRKVDMPMPEWLLDVGKVLNSLEVVAIDQKNGVVTCRSRK